MSDIGFQMSDD